MAVTDQLKAIPISEFHQCYDEWKKRLQRCVASEGSYFEGDNVECNARAIDDISRNFELRPRDKDDTSDGTHPLSKLP
ncbi:hypothetical protein TNCV_2611611 [Trichonephila clavipes]|nr:hypothetical protein TNCV_2611611 [Trichonephila clavipes]